MNEYAAHKDFKTLIHIDVYRFEDLKEITTIGWKDVLAKKETLTIIEWGGMVAHALPKNTVFCTITPQENNSRIFHIIL